MKPAIKTGLVALCFLIALSCKKESRNLPSSSITDESATSDLVTGKYGVVTIGTQKWMARNLDVTHYRNGDKIPQVKCKPDWKALTTGAWCWYNNDSTNGAIYGKLYNWYAVNDPRGLAPAGWHVPSYWEWDTLYNFLSPYNVGGKLKDTGTIEAGTGLWYAPNYRAVNKTGFTALPGGYRTQLAAFEYLGYLGYWWSSRELGSGYAYLVRLSYDNNDLSFYTGAEGGGFSVRCIKD